MLDPDILVGCIFPFVGIGQFAYVALVDRNFRDGFKKCVSLLHVQNFPPGDAEM
jgi:hypothetical protein